MRSHEQQTIHCAGKRARETALLPVLAAREADEQRDVQHVANADTVGWDHFEDMAPWGELGLDGDVFSPVGAIQLTREVRRLFLELDKSFVLYVCFASLTSIHTVSRLSP